jgi:hypothetical protein
MNKMGMKIDYSDNYFFENHLNDEAKALYADALILDKLDLLPVALLNHVEECQQCKKEIFAIYEILKKEGMVQGIKAHPFLGNVTGKYENVNKFYIYQILKYAAVFIILVGLSWLGFYLFSFNKVPGLVKNQIKIDTNAISKKNKNQESKKFTKEKTDSTVKLFLQHDELAVNMQVSPLFESLVASNYRSNDMEVISPNLNQQFTSEQPILFKFKGNLSVQVVIMIYNNKGRKIFEKDNITTNDYKLDIELLSGLYYWKLEKTDNLIYVGKFIVK